MMMKNLKETIDCNSTVAAYERKKVQVEMEN